VSVDEHRIELGPAPVFYRTAGGWERDDSPAPLYLHDVPTSSDDWIPFLERTGGIAPDLIGFGRSSKGVNLEYSVAGLADFVEDLLTALHTEAPRLVGHGWGAAVALELARRRADRTERLVLIDPLPLGTDFEWGRLARVYRIRFLGELAMGSTHRWMLARALRRATVDPAAWPKQRIATIWKHFDQGTQRAILRLHRSVDLPEDGATGPAAPTIVVWGEQDPWFPVRHAEAFTQQLPKARLERLAGAGHWPWLDRPELIEAIAAFVGAAA
jgi:pimeloyl-ACP methyl ester carboxylesterase